MNITKVKLSHNFSNKEIDAICSIFNQENIEYINKDSPRTFKSPMLKLKYLDVLIFNLSDYSRVIEIIINTLIILKDTRKPDFDGDILANFVIDFTDAGIPIISGCIVNYLGIIRSSAVERIYEVEL